MFRIWNICVVTTTETTTRTRFSAKLAAGVWFNALSRSACSINVMLLLIVLVPWHTNIFWLERMSERTNERASARCARIYIFHTGVLRLLRQWMAVNLMMALSKHIDIANNAKNIMSFYVYLNISSSRMCSHLSFGSFSRFCFLSLTHSLTLFLCQTDSVPFTEKFHVIYSFLAWLIQHFICILQSCSVKMAKFP